MSSQSTGRSFWGRIAREPLLHFLAAGAVLFAAVSLLSPPEPEADEAAIVVDRSALLSFMQYRANAFEPEAFESLLDSMTEQERQALIDDYVKEETLYREAQALGLSDGDYIIRQRMIQKMSFLMGDLAVAGEAIDQAALSDYFAANREAYAIAPSVTFTHVFFDADRRGAAEAEQAAREAITALSEGGAGFNDAPGNGDRFPFLRNYVERTFDYVASHFSPDFAAELAALSASEDWQGPIRSAYGWHAVLVTERASGRLPELADVREQVEADFRRAAADAALAQMTESVRGRYRIEIRDVGGDGE